MRYHISVLVTGSLILNLGCCRNQEDLLVFLPRTGDRLLDSDCPEAPGLTPAVWLAKPGGGAHLVPELQVPCAELEGDDVEDGVAPGGSRGVHLPSLQPLDPESGDSGWPGLQSSRHM